MLVLCRKIGEKIFINDDITLTVLEVSGNKVRLGIHAPSSTTILRAELTPRPRWQPSVLPSPGTDWEFQAADDQDGPVSPDLAAGP